MYGRGKGECGINIANNDVKNSNKMVKLPAFFIFLFAFLNV
jgi:hypothetical protein